jgi:methionyl-tRNA synthetase
MQNMYDPSALLPFGIGALAVALPLLIAIAIAVVVLKGFSLWYAARGSQKWWFIALLIINTLGILEIIYLLFFRPNAPYKSRGNSGTKSETSSEPSSVAT